MNIRTQKKIQMSLHEEMIAADGLQFEVRNYRKKGQYSWNWSCNICGDSATNSRKARFWVDAKQGSLVCHCFNCGYSAPFTLYLRDHHAHHAESFRRSTIREAAPTTLISIDSSIVKVSPMIPF